MLRLSDYERVVKFNEALGIDSNEETSDVERMSRIIEKRFSFPRITENEEDPKSEPDIFKEIIEDGGFVHYELRQKKSKETKEFTEPIKTRKLVK
jgi:hypothetical protein